MRGSWSRNTAAVLSAALMVSLIFCAPAAAQSSSVSASPGTSQYEECGTVEANVGACQGAIEVYGGVEAAAETSGRGTDAVNDALGGTAPAGATTSASASASGDGDDASEAGEGPASIARLPETGGTSPTVLGLGILLVVSGLAAR